VVAVSNYTWCPTRQQQLTAAQVVNDAVALATNTKLFRVNSSAGVQLFLLNAQVVVAGGGSYRFVDTSSKAFKLLVACSATHRNDLVLLDMPHKHTHNMGSLPF
jgi:ribulose 1,5-bisphosphate carboxylase large subunit-like protein